MKAITEETLEPVEIDGNVWRPDINRFGHFDYFLRASIEDVDKLRNDFIEIVMANKHMGMVKASYEACNELLGNKWLTECGKFYIIDIDGEFCWICTRNNDGRFSLFS